jgi:5-deoxy-glucuronate isomerase
VTTPTTAQYELEVTQASAGWDWCSLRVFSLDPGGSHQWYTGDEEMMVLPLSGAATVSCDGEKFELRGRRDVFSRITDCAYVPRDTDVVVTSQSGGRFALPAARCSRRLSPRYRAAEEVPVDLRGAGACSRQVNNFCSADSFEADRLIAVEVLTPGGNWSSYPPHKHDEDRPGEEAVLEEIYYYEIADPRGAPPPVHPPKNPSLGSARPMNPTPTPASRGLAYQRVYGTPERPIDILREVRTGDVVLIPHGWHGPSMAAPGYDLYYLNVMAGPGAERTWLICDDPAHAWVRDTWAQQSVDPRLPLTSTVDRSEL